MITLWPFLLKAIPATNPPMPAPTMMILKLYTVRLEDTKENGTGGISVSVSTCNFLSILAAAMGGFYARGGEGTAFWARCT